ncbi:hypothetical protein INR49_015501 [Caranx melampygus]|nr:hypothetical protein INR49_015501 [Caranx melampygus]
MGLVALEKPPYDLLTVYFIKYNRGLEFVFIVKLLFNGGSSTTSLLQHGFSFNELGKTASEDNGFKDHDWGNGSERGLVQRRVTFQGHLNVSRRAQSASVFNRVQSKHKQARTLLRWDVGSFLNPGFPLKGVIPPLCPSPASLGAHSELAALCNPLIEILSLWQHDSLPQIPTAQRCFSMFQQLILVGALWDVLLRLEGLR